MKTDSHGADSEGLACRNEDGNNGPDEGYITVEGDLSLFYRRWRPNPENDRGKNLLIVHGACEHGGRFLSLGAKAAGQGWNVIAPDLRGHGRSTGQFVHVNEFQDYLRDLKAMMAAHELKPEETVIIGCSMGGLITIRFQQWWYREHGHTASRVFYVLAPLLGIRHPIEEWKKATARMLGQFFPQTRFRSTLSPTQLTHDQEVIRSRGSDPYMRNRVSARWYLESTQAMRDAWEQVDAIRVPMRIFQGGGDTVVDPSAARGWADSVNRHHQRQAVNFHCFPGWYHELLKEIEGKAFEDLLVRLLAEDWQATETSTNGKQSAFAKPHTTRPVAAEVSQVASRKVDEAG